MDEKRDISKEIDKEIQDRRASDSAPTACSLCRENLKAMVKARRDAQKIDAAWTAARAVDINRRIEVAMSLGIDVNAEKFWDTDANQQHRMIVDRAKEIAANDKVRSTEQLT